jgi:flagellar motor protein MotB
VSKASCKCKKTECEECPEWIFTFADLVMLMMGFFVILWVLKPAPGKDTSPQANDDWIKTAAAIREAFGYVPDPHSKDPVDIEMLFHTLQKLKLDGPGNGGKINREKKAPDGHDDETTTIRLGKYATEGGKLCFERGDTTLSDDAKAALTEIATLVRGHRNLIVVKGHTSLDDFADGGTAQQKMELSVRRAEAAAEFLRGQGVDSALLRVQGCSTFEPVVQHQYTSDALRANRRVEVEATATLVEDLQDGSSQQGGAGATPATQPGD